MKKVFLSLATIAFVATGSLTMTSCGSDDSATPAPAPDDEVPTPEDGEVPVGKDIELALVTAPEEIYEGTPFQLSIKTVDGENVDGAQLYAFGEAITGAISEDGMFTINGPAGPVDLYAMYEDVESNTVTVEVLSIPVAEPEGSGEFQYGGDTYTSEASYLYFNGFAYEDETETTVISVWQLEAEATSGDTKAAILFSTPSTVNQSGNYVFEVPTATNTTGLLAAAIVGQDIFQTNENVMLEFNAVPNANGNAFEGDYSATSGDIEGEAFSVEFDGVMPYVYNAGKTAAKSTNKAGIQNAKTVVNASTATKIVKYTK